MYEPSRSYPLSGAGTVGGCVGGGEVVTGGTTGGGW
jgi:hypothetical protein